jgi:Ca-activated chloride channel homolog
MRINPFYKASGLLTLALGVTLVLSGCDDGVRTGTTQSGQAEAQTISEDSTAPSITFPADAVVSLDDNDYVVFDGSGSMAGCARSGSRCQSKIDGGREALKSVIKLLPTKKLNLGLFVFDRNGVSERIQLGAGNRKQFLKAVDDIRADGGTPLGEGIRAGAEALIAQYKKQMGYGTYRLIVVTDGEPSSPYEVPQALKFIQNSGVPIEIYTIGFGMDDPEHPLRKGSVSFTAAYSSDELKKALEEAVSEQSTFVPTFQSQ